MISPTRFLRFSLRTLFILITVLAIWLGTKMSAARRQKEAVETMLNLGATVQYDYQMKRVVPATIPYVLGHPGVKYPDYEYDSNAPLPGPAWLRKKLGDDYFCTVVAVNYLKPKFAKSDLDQLAKLPLLQSLLFDGRAMQSQLQDSDFAVLGQLGDLRVLQITDCARVRGSFISELANPRQLQWLCLNDCSIDDSAMEQIGHLQNLEKLMLWRTRITGRSLLHLQSLSKLEDLQLGDTEITDVGIKYLAPLSKLTYVNLRLTKVTARAVAELQKVLPTTNIYGP